MYTNGLRMSTCRVAGCGLAVHLVRLRMESACAETGEYRVGQVVVNLGISLPTRSGLRPSQLTALAYEAEAQGFTSCFVAERCGDALAIAAGVSNATSRIEVGTAVTNINQRHPAFMAVTCAVVNELSGGRLRVGLGTGNPSLNSKWLGIEDDSPIRRMREYVNVMRLVMDSPTVSFHGDVFQLEDFVPDLPVESKFPIDIGALQTGMMKLSADVADGVVLNLVHRPSLADIVADIRRECIRIGRSADFRISCVVPVCVADEFSSGLERGKTVIANYALHPAVARVFDRQGYEAVRRNVQVHLQRGDYAGALGQVSNGMVADFVVIGNVSECRETLSLYADAGIDLPIVYPVAGPAGWEEAITELLTLPN